MVGTSKTLKVADIVEINRRMITHFGGIFFEGDDNLANRGSLEYVLAEIYGSLYGQELYPDIFRVGGLIAGGLLSVIFFMMETNAQPWSPVGFSWN
jgi:hypothetical protein